MTPKEKAIELLGKYEYLVKTWDCYNDEPLEIQYKIPEMKECALIVVDEILDSTMYYFDDNFENYWQEVKQEIEKL